MSILDDPNVVADFDHWSKMPCWTLDEATALAFGKPPEIVNWDTIKSAFSGGCSSPFIGRYQQLREVVLRADKMNDLRDPVRPRAFLDWVQRVGIEIDERLLEQFEMNSNAGWDGFDENEETYPQELDIALTAWRAVTKAPNPTLTPKQQVMDWLEQSYTGKEKLTHEARKRIAMICNWEKSGGRPSQENK